MKAIRLLGSKFFHEVQTGGKTTSKTKVYETLVASEEKDPYEMTYVATSANSSTSQASSTLLRDDDDLTPDMLESLVAQEDGDAICVQSFEAEFEDFLQETPEMHCALVSYVEARARLKEKKRTRRFWPVGQNKGRGKGKQSFKGGKGGRQSPNLLSKIARSERRICHKVGHWKAECPHRDGAGTTSSTTTTAAPGASAAANVVEPAHQDGTGHDDLEIFTDADLVNQAPLSSCHVSVQDCFSLIHINWNNPSLKSRMKVCVHNMLQKMRLPKKSNPDNQPAKQPMPSAQAELPVTCQSHDSCSQPARMENVEVLPSLHALQVAEDTMSHAILDTGASRCVIGSQILNQLLQRLPKDVRSTVQQKPSQIKFRFGNNQTLTSKYRVLVPLNGSSHERVWLRVEVVDGMTPFLFSKRAFKQLGGILDSTRDVCTFTRLQKSFELSTNSTGLYLLDMLDFCQPHVTDVDIHTDVFVGNASHVGDNTCHGRETKIPCRKFQSLRRPFKHSVACLKPSSSSASHVSDPVKSALSQQVEPRSCHQHAEGDGQHHHGDVDSGLASVHEHDRSAQPGSSRRGAHASTDQSTASYAPGDVQAKSHSAAHGREPEQEDACGSNSPDDHAQQPNDCRSNAYVGNSERRGGRRFLSGLIGQASYFQCLQDDTEEQKEPSQGASSIQQCHGTASAAQRQCLPDAGLWRPISNEIDPCRMGPKEGDLGQEASRPHVLPSPVGRHGVLRMEPAKVPLPSSSSTRLFVDYCRAQLEADAAQDRLKAMNVRRLN